MWFQELTGSFYSNSSLLSSDLKLVSETTAFYEQLTVGWLLNDVDIYLVHRYVVRRIYIPVKLSSQEAEMLT